jgi:pimeloyl-ACP methyl ester carboxylesterase
VIRKAYVDTSGGQLHFRYVRIAGKSELEPLVLLSRTPTGSAGFEPLMRELGDWRNLYALDAPGCGPSFDPPGVPTSDDCAGWFAEAIDALAIDGFHLLGDQTGTQSALALALRWPERVRSLALVSRDMPAGLVALRCPLLALWAGDERPPGLLERVAKLQPAAHVEPLGPGGIDGQGLDTPRLAVALRDFVTSPSR